MNEQLKVLCDELTKDIQRAYEEPVSVTEAERLAAKFLGAQLAIATELSTASLDARMRKTGLKAIKSAARVEEIKKHDRKPAEGILDDVVNLDATVMAEQDAFDKSEVNAEMLKNYYDIFLNAHIFMRGVAKGNFSG